MCEEWRHRRRAGDPRITPEGREILMRLVNAANLSHDGFGFVTVVGTVVNNTENEVKGPISVTVVCFANNNPTVADQTFTHADTLAAGASSSFTATFYSETSASDCSSFIAGASGYSA